MISTQGLCHCKNFGFIDKSAAAAAQMLLGAGKRAQILRRLSTKPPLRPAGCKKSANWFPGNPKSLQHGALIF
jgi:hypothetical protein